MTDEVVVTDGFSAVIDHRYSQFGIRRFNTYLFNPDLSLEHVRVSLPIVRANRQGFRPRSLRIFYRKNSIEATLQWCFFTTNSRNLRPFDTIRHTSEIKIIKQCFDENDRSGFRK